MDKRLVFSSVISGDTSGIHPFNSFFKSKDEKIGPAVAGEIISPQAVHLSI